jgi:glycosyltransferase involved in cell wall biosynthesis
VVGPAIPPTIEVSLVLTVLNEAASIDELLACLAAQTVRPRELIVVDGGSTDATLRRLAAWSARLPLRLLTAPGTTISAGRNRGITAATSAVIVVTDAGTRPAPGWLAAISSRLLAPVTAIAPAVIAGWFVADPRSPFELAMGATVLPSLAEIDGRHFLPSSRSVAFRRAAWQAVGGYPEWLDYGEDLVFDLALKAAGYRFAFVPAAVVRFRPRPTLRAFWQQYFRYARGDGKANLWPRRHLVRYTAYNLGLLLLLLSWWAGWPGRLAALALLLSGGLAYLWRPYARLLPALGALGWPARLRVIAWVPVIRLVGDLAKLAGYPVGLLWRWWHYGWHAGWAEIGAQRPSSVSAAERPAADG